MELLRTENLSSGYEGKRIIDALDFSMEKGEFIALLGPNGSGKSTFLKTITGNLKSLSGSIYLEGKDRKKLKERQIARIMSYLPQNPISPGDISVRDLVSYGRNPHKDLIHKDIEGEVIKDWALEETNLKNMENRFMSTLSGGERQRAWIAMCLCQKTNLIVLDEPTSSLDIKHAKDILDALKKLNRNFSIGVLIVLHDINQAMKYADKIALFKNGKIHAMGYPKSIMNKKIMKEVYNIEGEFINFGEDKRLHFIAY